ncbi:MAG: DUF885 family protein [Steroidobacteraceae bacterium]
MKIRNSKTAQIAGALDSGRRNFTRGCSGLAAALLIEALPYRRAFAASGEDSRSAARLQAFLEEFAAAGAEETSLDLSAGAFRSALKTTSAKLQRLRAINRDALDGDDLLNYRFAESLLVGQVLAQERMLWSMDPRVYLPFSELSQLIENPDATEADSAKALVLLKALPAQLADGQRNLKVNIARFRELALFMADGARGVLHDAVPAFASQHPAQASGLVAAGARALRALDEFRIFLRDRLPRKPRGDYAMGKSAYDRMLKEQYLLDHDSDSLYAYGRRQFDATLSELEQVAARIDPGKTWKELAVEIKNSGPEPGRMIEAHQEWVDKAKAHVVEKKLVPIPWKERVEVVTRAQFQRKNSYYGDFDGAKGPNADGVWVGYWRINPFEDQWDEETKRQYLTEHDWGVIIDTAPHETYAGHHVQEIYQAHNLNKLRQKFGIAIFSEGWGLYNETLMYETGFFRSERIHLRQLQLRLWRIARVIWDVGLNTGRLTYDECVSLLADGVGFLRWAAELEVDGSATEPGYRIGYFMGASEIMRMREEVKALLGPRFTLSDFHERLLKVGNMPPALMREGLMQSYKS